MLNHLVIRASGVTSCEGYLGKEAGSLGHQKRDGPNVDQSIVLSESICGII